MTAEEFLEAMDGDGCFQASLVECLDEYNMDPILTKGGLIMLGQDCQMGCLLEAMQKEYFGQVVVRKCEGSYPKYLAKTLAPLLVARLLARVDTDELSALILIDQNNIRDPLRKELAKR